MPFEFCCYLLSALFFFFWIRQPQKVLLKKLGFSFLGLGFSLFLAELILNLLGLYRAPLSVFTLLANTAVGIFYFLVLKFKRWNVEKVAPVVASLAFLLTLLGSRVGIFQKVGVFVLLHVGTFLFTFTLLLFSAFFSLMRVWGERRLKEKNLNLPLGVPLNLWVKLERSFFFFGFIFLTLDLILNFVLLKAQAENVGFDSRIAATFFIWLYYWLLFHLERWGVTFFKKHFAVFNLLGTAFLVLSLIFTHHNF